MEMLAHNRRDVMSMGTRMATRAAAPARYYEIADRLHFANPPAFNNFFKRETGLTPMEYRESK